MPLTSSNFGNCIPSIFLSMLFLCIPTSWAANACNKQKPESVKSFLDGLSEGSIQIADRIRLPFNTYYWNCPKGGQAGSTCFSESYGSFTDVQPAKALIDTRSKSEKKADLARRKQEKKQAQIQQSEMKTSSRSEKFTWVGSYGQNAINELIKNLDVSGLRHAALGEAIYKISATKKGAIEIRLYDLNGEFFRSFEGKIIKNCIYLNSENLRIYKSAQGESTEDLSPVFSELPSRVNP